MHNQHTTVAALALAGARHLSQIGSLVLAFTALAPAFDEGLEHSEEVSGPGVQASSGSNCGGNFSTASTYPGLPSTTNADISGEAGVDLYLETDRMVVEIDSCFYEVDRTLELDFDGLDEIELMIELHGGGAQPTVFVTRPTGSETYTPSGTSFDYVLDETDDDVLIGFELAGAGQSVPTTPIAQIRPKDGDPPPT